MQIRTNAWHLRVFLQAYVHDRFWIDKGVASPTEECKTPETEAYAVFEKEFWALPPNEQYSKKNQEKLQELATASQKTFAEWRNRQEALYTTNKSREVSERLYSGRMSLCPYFWSIVSALLFYYVLIRGTRPFRNFFNRIADGLATAVGVIIILSLVGFIGYGVYSIHEKIPNPAQVVVSVKDSVREYRQNRVQEQAVKAERQRELQQLAQAQMTWAQQHPEEVQRQRLQDAEESRRKSLQNWQDFKELAQSIGWLLLVIMGVVAAVAIIIGFVYMVGTGLEWLANRYGWGEPKPPGAFRLWLGRVWEFLGPVRRVCKDTKELVLAFAKAKKEKVCPYLEIENGNHQPQV